LEYSSNNSLNITTKLADLMPDSIEQLLLFCAFTYMTLKSDKKAFYAEVQTQTNVLKCVCVGTVMV